MAQGQGLAGLTINSVDDLSDDRAQVLVLGRSGSGKTTTASTIARLGRTLFLDLVGEYGVRSFQGADYAGNIDVVRPDSVTQMDDIFWYLDKGNHPYEAVVIDSMTSLQNMATRYVLGYSETAVKEIQQGSRGMQLQDWGQTKGIMGDTATFWYGLAKAGHKKPIHVVMTSQVKAQEDDEGRESFVPDVQGGVVPLLLQAPDYVVFTDVEDNQDAMLDETLPPVTHILRFGNDPRWKLKAHLPTDLRGKIPSVIGRKNPPDLASLAKILRLGGIDVAQSQTSGGSPEQPAESGAETASTATTSN